MTLDFALQPTATPTTAADRDAKRARGRAIDLDDTSLASAVTDVRQAVYKIVVPIFDEL